MDTASANMLTNARENFVMSKIKFLTLVFKLFQLNILPVIQI